MRDGHEAKQSRGFGGSPLAARAVGQRHHHRLQLLAGNLEFADALELHGLAGEILLGCNSVREDIEKEGAGTRRVDTESNQVTDHRLKMKQGVNFV